MTSRHRRMYQRLDGLMGSILSGASFQTLDVAISGCRLFIFSILTEIPFQHSIINLMRSYGQTKATWTTGHLGRRQRCDDASGQDV